MAKNNGGSCRGRKDSKSMECGLNQFPNSSNISSNSSRAFLKSKATGAVESSGICACHRSILKRQKVFQPDTRVEPLSRPVGVASTPTASRFPILPSMPPPPPRPATAPQTAPPPSPPSPVILESSISWEEMEKNKPLKKRKVKLIRETSSTSPSE